MWSSTIAIFVFIVASIAAKTLDLSNRGMKKEEFFVKLQQQVSLADIHELILRGNEFDSFLDCSTNLESLHVLDLSQNHLQKFFFLCKDEYNLQVLNVSHNKLEYIDDNAFNDRIPKLKKLDVSWNRLSVVNETMFQYFRVLEYLTLANNPIYDGIHENAFWNLTSLQYLNLSNVSISHFTSDMFKTLNNLSVLDLSQNPMSTVPLLPVSLKVLDLSSTYVSSLRGVYLPQLRELRLNNMQELRELSLNDLENLTSLEVLSLDGSKKLIHLKLFPYNAYLLPRLQRLSVNDSSLTTLDYSLISIIKKTPTLSLANNPWNCDCRMLWINVSNVTRSLSREIKCHTPDRHFDKRLSEIPDYELECDDEASLFQPVLWTCILILLVAIILAMGFFLLRRPLGRWDIRRKNRDTVTYKNVDESNNDMVRILAVNDAIERNDE
ncbi:trophoblast glycoprotein [Megachile rotundata]|uniref:trophoblast glycoprotein n=1 Tax=Megachile rotundata TaxID=143995 RepID=UPI003FD305D7